MQRAPRAVLWVRGGVMRCCRREDQAAAPPRRGSLRWISVVAPPSSPSSRLGAPAYDPPLASPLPSCVIRGDLAARAFADHLAGPAASAPASSSPPSSFFRQHGFSYGATPFVR